MKRSEMREQAFLLTFEGLFSSGEDIDEVIELLNDADIAVKNKLVLRKLLNKRYFYRC